MTPGSAQLRLPDEDQVDLLPYHFIHEVQDIEHVPAKPGEFGDEQRCAGSKLIEHEIDHSDLLVLPGRGLDLDHLVDHPFIALSVFDKQVLLLVQILGVRADPDVPDNPRIILVIRAG